MKEQVTERYQSLEGELRDHFTQAYAQMMNKGMKKRIKLDKWQRILNLGNPLITIDEDGARISDEESKKVLQVLIREYIV